MKDFESLVRKIQEITEETSGKNIDLFLEKSAEFVTGDIPLEKSAEFAEFLRALANEDIFALENLQKISCDKKCGKLTSALQKKKEKTEKIAKALKRLHSSGSKKTRKKIDEAIKEKAKEEIEKDLKDVDSIATSSSLEENDDVDNIKKDILDTLKKEPEDEE
jgi:uncharacterized membrane-anchored protein YjiN (DUF445 family)